MLTETLRGLERDWPVSRTVFAEVPPRVEYELTAVGHGLQAPPKALEQWAVDYFGQAAESRRSHDDR